MTTYQGKFNITRSITWAVCALALTCLSPRFAASIMLTKLPAIIMTARLFGPFHPGGEITFLAPQARYTGHAKKTIKNQPVASPAFGRRRYH